MFIDFSSVIFKFASKEVVLKHKYNYYGHKIANLIHYEIDEVHVVIAPSWVEKIGVLFRHMPKSWKQSITI